VKKLNSKESEERLIWFKDWVSSMPNRLNNWKEQLPKEIKVKLDKTPESLLQLEQFILTKFANPREARDPANSKMLDAVSTYIGEVLRLNLPDKPEWDVELTKLEGNAEYYFYPYLKRTSPFIGLNPHTLIPNTIKVREGNKLFTFYEKQLSVYQKKKGVMPSKVILGKGGFSYQYFILVKDESFELNEIERTLEAYYAKKGSGDNVYFHNDRHLLVNMEGNYYFHFQLDTSEGVLQESKEIAENYKGDKDKSVIASCKSRVEFWGDEDPEGDYINDHMYLLEQLMQNDKLLIFDFRNGVFLDEL